MKNILISSLYICVFVLCASLLGISIDAASADDSLDGRSFSVELTEANKNETTKDEMIFKDGTFFSAECEQYGFTPAPYESRSKDGAVMFKSTLTSGKEGKTEWEGSVKGDEISGTMFWSKEGQDPIIYSYKGTIKK
ncbi:MAG TPA: hypothetical protein VLG45_00985 [Thermodesulfobacteriota bacterium]|nr:hypothetical protein [Thermodesulfobacteriota bacterium]